MRLDSRVAEAEIEAALRHAAQGSLGDERAAALAPALRQTAAWLAQLARHPMDLADTPPDSSGVPDEDVP